MKGPARLVSAHLGMSLSDAGTGSSARYRDVVVTSHRPRGMTWDWRTPESPQVPSTLALVHVIRGGLSLREDDFTIEMSDRPHQVRDLMLTSSRPVRLRWSDDAICTVAWIPLGAVVGQGVAEDSIPLVVQPTTLVSGVREFMLAISRPATRSALSDYVIERLIVEMAFGAVLEGGAIDLKPPPTSALDRARGLMLVNRANARYTADDVARELGVSLRQLQRVFAEAGSTPNAELRGLRAELARTLLTDPKYAPLAGTEIARHAGFTGSAAMRRALSAHAPATEPATARR